MGLRGKPQYGIDLEQYLRRGHVAKQKQAVVYRIRTLLVLFVPNVMFFW